MLLFSMSDCLDAQQVTSTSFTWDNGMSIIVLSQGDSVDISRLE